MGKILIIRGGALGDFILTLPGIQLLRKAFPDTEIEVLGYAQFIRVAQEAGLVDRAKSIEYGQLASFFAGRAPKAQLSEELIKYFGSFDVVVSYLYDPDDSFCFNLEHHCGVKTLLKGVHKPVEPAEGELASHAALQLAKPLESLAVYPDGDGLPRLSLSLPVEEEGKDTATATRVLSIAPGSGSERKNWKADRWIALCQELSERSLVDELLLITGEVETSSGLSTVLRQGLDKLPLPYRHLDSDPLPDVASALAKCVIHVGNDSGISHLAASVGVKSLALFGPTNPKVWQPVGADPDQVRGLEAMEELDVAEVLKALNGWL